jgi:hypothetical protein
LQCRVIKSQSLPHRPASLVLGGPNLFSFPFSSSFPPPRCPAASSSSSSSSTPPAAADLAPPSPRRPPTMMLMLHRPTPPVAHRSTRGARGAAPAAAPSSADDGAPGAGATSVDFFFFLASPFGTCDSGVATAACGSAHPHRAQPRRCRRAAGRRPAQLRLFPAATSPPAGEPLRDLDYRIFAGDGDRDRLSSSSSLIGGVGVPPCDAMRPAFFPG